LVPKQAKQQLECETTLECEIT